MLLSDAVRHMDQAIQMLSNQYDEILVMLTNQHKTIRDLAKRVENVEQAGMESQVKQLKADSNEFEWRSRAYNLEIHGITQTEGENLIAHVYDFFKKTKRARVLRHGCYRLT